MGYQDCPCFKCDHGGERENELNAEESVLNLLHGS